MLDVKTELKECVALRILHNLVCLIKLTVPASPTAVLSARRKVICDVCSIDPEQPVMIDEGHEWRGHVQSRKHRRLRRERERPAASREPKERKPSATGLELEDDLDLDCSTDLFGR
jgi:hypothetical protein